MAKHQHKRKAQLKYWLRVRENNIDTPKINNFKKAIKIKRENKEVSKDK